MASSSKPQLLPESFEAYNEALQTAALKAIKSSVVAFPADVAFHRSVHPEYGKDLDSCSSRILSITNKLLALSASANASQSGRGKGKGRLVDQEDVVDNFRSLVVDAVDQMLERADISLDQHLGRIKAPAIAVQPSKPTPAKVAKPTVSKGRLDPALQHASHLPKPQLQFKKRADNITNLPWRHSVAHKYNAKVPLGFALHEDESDAQHANHPYFHEIKHSKYPARTFQPSDPKPPKSFEDTPFTWVATLEAFSSMMDVLRQAPEVAVDLEHHDYRTFGGFVCLMQISTRDQDWIVDTLVLRDELEELNEVFTNPDVVKVFHGAESDIVWLQRDFNLYIVNLFDTYHASKLLDFPRHGLANLLEMYCDFTPDKRYQLADWRIRPLPQEMLDYARSDTHYLLYIYDNLRNALLDRGASASRSASRSGSPSTALAVTDTENTPTLPADPHAFINEVHARSATTALRVHEREVYDAQGGTGSGGWDVLARKWNKGLLVAGADALGAAGALQRAMYRAVHAWRDAVAREDDESTRYVLPNHYLFQLAERPPADMASLLAVFHPVPPVVRRRVKELLDAIRAAMKDALGNANIMKATTVVAETAAPTSGNETKMEVDLEAVVPVVTTTPSELWSTVKRPIAASSSALLAAPPAAVRTPFSAALSALLGDNSRSALRAFKAVEFEDILSRVHGSLVIAPTISMAPAAIATAMVKTEADTTMAVDAPSELVASQVEIPFVPAVQRSSTTVADPADDAIVVVGQRQKKRKRTRSTKPSRAPSDAPSDNQPAESVEDAVKEEIVPFDYANEPNVLDAGYAATQVEEAARGPGGKRKKQKKEKGAAPIAYGDFPAPPRAQNEVRGGNKARTFR